MKKALLLVAVLSSFSTFAGEDHLGSVSSTTASPATFTATAGASLTLQCTGPVRYAAGSAGSPPTAGATSALLAFSSLSGEQDSRPIQLGTGQDRISVISARSTGTGFSCEVYTQTVPAVTSTSSTVRARRSWLIPVTCQIAWP